MPKCSGIRNGGAVEATDDCDATSMCWDVMDVDGEWIGVCRPLCTGSADSPECPEGYTCQIGADSSLALCIPVCNPLVQDCGNGLACFWADLGFNCIFTSQDIPAGQPCGFINDCAAGLSCTNAGVLPACDGSVCCSAFCDLELGDGPCETLLPGTACVPFFPENEAPPSYEQVGICILPP